LEGARPGSDPSRTALRSIKRSEARGLTPFWRVVKPTPAAAPGSPRRAP